MSENMPPQTTESSMRETYETRRAMVTRAFGRAKKLGLPIEDSTEFEGWLEEWARGEIDTPTLRNRYIQLLRARDTVFRNRHERSKGQR
ncbi:hypothetical protein B5K06_30625 [Rhizobium grahamii]|uniref:Antitoxin VbhA domain-containing protein n=1 Tax=Rhizobium grahamii TaxID=1120045 RepID=A0A370KFG6_9HYPH|nr:hypothetical protein B5K06_30625 [Rhizobium grahamii]